MGLLHRGCQMVLIAADIQSKSIVKGAKPDGWRATTYDATVGCTIRGGVEINATDYTLPPRSIVWVISNETFALPDDVTGLATLKTQWTHEGVLALNVGIVDPGWDGPLAAALVNFGSSDFTFSKGDKFFRLLFHNHKSTGSNKIVKTMEIYKKEIMQRSRLFSPTFLSMESLTREVSSEVLRLPKWGYILAFLAVVVSFIAIYAPIAVSVWTDYYVGKPKIEELESRVDELENVSVKNVGKSPIAGVPFNFDHCDLHKVGTSINLAF